MSSEMIMAGGDAMTAAALGEFHLTLTVAGDVEDLKVRLAGAVEKLGYHVVADDPLVAKRGGTGYGSVTSSVLDYARTVAFRLQPAGTGATRVTFNYTGYPLNYKGGRSVITHEAKAIAALASSQRDVAACTGCGARSVDDSRFCRKCGVPVLPEPQELMVLQMANAAHAGTRDLAIASAGFALGLATLALILGAKGFEHWVAAVVFATMWMLPSLFLLITGFRHLSKAFAANPNVGSLSSADLSYTTSAFTFKANTARLPEGPPPSVVDGTTDLLPDLVRTKEASSVRATDESR